jgi:carboxymethylenebutenolidase
VTIHNYSGVDHAFARHNGVNYDKTAAELADSRTLACFKAALG